MGDGDGDGDGDGVTPLVTAIRGRPSPLSHRTGCCGLMMKNQAFVETKSRAVILIGQVDCGGVE